MLKVQVDRTVIDPERIRSVEHSKLAGLQVADAVASGFHFALKVNCYGETEAGYLQRNTFVVEFEDEQALIAANR